MAKTKQAKKGKGSNQKTAARKRAATKSKPRAKRASTSRLRPAPSKILVPAELTLPSLEDDVIVDSQPMASQEMSNRIGQLWRSGVEMLRSMEQTKKMLMESLEAMKRSNPSLASEHRHAWSRLDE